MTKMKEEKNHSAKEELSFEKAFERLEKILETLNSTHPSLEESLKLYEEADHLIIQCHKKLVHAEKKVEMLMKGRSGELQMTESNGEAPKPMAPKPMTQDLPLS